jgi:aryl carrier-like protein
VRLLDNGDIKYIGRNDSQVKIRGFRIEPGEIESLIKQYPGIIQAVVVALDWQGHKQLVAYYTSDDTVAEDIDKEALRQSLQQLPDYMQPTQIIAVAEFKLTLNGKLDYRALPTPSFSSGGYSAPRNAEETQMCETIAELLKVKQVGIEDDFFRIGGDSILSIQLSSRLRRMDIHLSVKAIFVHKTVKRMLASIEPQTQTLAEQDVLSGSFALLPVQQWFFAQLASDLLPAYQHWNQSFMLSVPALEPPRLSEILPSLMAHHDMLRSSFTQVETGDEVR